MKSTAWALALVSLFIVACDEDETTSTPEGAPDIVLQFGAVDGDGADFACGAENLRVAGLTDVTPNDMRFYVYDIELLDAAGQPVSFRLEQDGKWQHDNVALLDFEDGSEGCEFVIFGRLHTADTNTVVRGTPSAPGPYSGLRFRVGVPPELNHTDAQTAPPPLNVGGVDHGPADGRQFIRVAFYSPSVGTVGSEDYNLYSFRSVCNNVTEDGNVPAEATECTKANRPEVVLQTDDFDPQRQRILFDVEALFSDYTSPGTANGPHPDLNPGGRIDCFSPLHAGNFTPPMGMIEFDGAQRCGTAYDALGLDYTTGEADADGQRVFRLE